MKIKHLSLVLLLASGCSLIAMKNGNPKKRKLSDTDKTEISNNINQMDVDSISTEFKNLSLKRKSDQPSNQVNKQQKTDEVIMTESTEDGDLLTNPLFEKLVEINNSKRRPLLAELELIENLIKNEPTLVTTETKDKQFTITNEITRVHEQMSDIIQQIPQLQDCECVLDFIDRF